MSLESRRLRAEVDAVFEGQYHTIRQMMERLDGRSICHYCGRKLVPGIVHRTRVNVWGTVCIVPTCMVCHAGHDHYFADTI